MSMIDSINVGYNVTLLEELLFILDIEGGYLRAYAKTYKKKKSRKGIEFGGKPHLLDTMIIMRTLWEDNEGKYARVDGIKLCS